MDVTVRSERLVLVEPVPTVFDAVTPFDIERELTVSCDIGTGIVELVASQGLPRVGSKCTFSGAEFDVIECLIPVVHLHIRREDPRHSVGVAFVGSQRLGERHQPATLADDRKPIGRPSAELSYRRTVLQRGSVKFGVSSRKIDPVTVGEFVSRRRRERDHACTLTKALDSRGIIEAECVIPSDRNSLVHLWLDWFLIGLLRCSRDINESFSTDVFGRIVEDLR
jgi:hypothetical protein